MFQASLSVGVLLYGDHTDLAYRCLRSIWNRLELPSAELTIQDIRLGLNEISPQTRKVVNWFVEQVPKHYCPVLTYDCPQNAFKYPLMRRMWLDPAYKPAEWIMWFDDDSYLSSDSWLGWWRSVLLSATTGDMLGKVYYQRMLSGQWSWITKQAWFNPAVGQPLPFRRFGNRPSFKFCTGGWWVIRSRILQDHDWPTTELKLIGGDSMLGELCRHRGYKLIDFDQGVHINANAEGKHSSATPRGATPEARKRGAAMLGNGAPVEDYQNFECDIRFFGKEGCGQTVQLPHQG